MSIFLNPVVFSVILMCILCLCKLNVMFSLIIACFVGGLMGGMSVSDISSTMLAGFSNNAEAALAYILLGTFASCLAYTGLADIFAKRVAQAIRGSKLSDSDFLHHFSDDHSHPHSIHSHSYSSDAGKDE